MKLAILLTTSTESENTFTVKSLAGAALDQGHEVGLFLMDDGVYNIKAFDDLIARGLKVAVCTHNCNQRCVEKVDGVLSGSQYDWSQMVKEADRVLSFGT